MIYLIKVMNLSKEGDLKMRSEDHMKLDKKEIDILKGGRNNVK